MVSHMSHNTYTGLRVRKIHGNVRPHHISGRQIPCGSILPTAYTQRVLNGHHTAMWDQAKGQPNGCSFFLATIKIFQHFKKSLVNLEILCYYAKAKPIRYSLCPHGRVSKTSLQPALMVKRSRRRPLTAESRVRFPMGVPFRSKLSYSSLDFIFVICY